MKYILILAIMLFTVNLSNAQRMYDGSGSQIGRVDGERYYDGSGRQIGRFNSQRVYDGSGRQIGRIDGDRVYDGSGQQVGRIDGEKLYDGSGRQMGRLSGDKVYDGSGRQKGPSILFIGLSIYDLYDGVGACLLISLDYGHRIVSTPFSNNTSIRRFESLK
jgi:hypothetical protein